jgi:bisphosphoglycerate-independent phosphoglycerate mutase (AlkP superfamily)
MSDEYLRRISIAIDNVKRIFENFKNEYAIIILADHGGHERSHGSQLPEDMIIPLFFYGYGREIGEIKENISLLDIAPTIADYMGIPAEADWEGQSLVIK